MVYIQSYSSCGIECVGVATYFELERFRYRKHSFSLQNAIFRPSIWQAACQVTWCAHVYGTDAATGVPFRQQFTPTQRISHCPHPFILR
jgi:hypothetical protein